MGCGDACPIYPGKRYVDWELADPAGKSLHEVRAIRDEIDSRVQGTAGRAGSLANPLGFELLARRLGAEFVGTALLLIAVVGSGIGAQRRSASTSASSC